MSAAQHTPPASAMRVIAMDDWAIYAEASNGELHVTYSEVWPEWLDFPQAPEDMADEDFKRATLSILRFKLPQWATFRSIFAADETAEDLAYYAAEIYDLASKQAVFIAKAQEAASP